MDTNDGAPAYPVLTMNNGDRDAAKRYGCLGLTKRERFAMAAMQSLIETVGVDSRQSAIDDVCALAKRYADTMLEQLR